MKFHGIIMNNSSRHLQSGFQDFARDWRRVESSSILRTATTNKVYEDSGIVLAQHADDQIETILLKILRGVDISNLRGVSNFPFNCFFN